MRASNGFWHFYCVCEKFLGENAARFWLLPESFSPILNGSDCCCCLCWLKKTATKKNCRKQKIVKSCWPTKLVAETQGSQTSWRKFSSYSCCFSQRRCRSAAAVSEIKDMPGSKRYSFSSLSLFRRLLGSNNNR